MDSLLASGRSLRPASPEVLSALSTHDEGAPYDRRASFYDRLIGSRVYNRLAWGASVTDYRAFAAEALAADDGPFLDAGCGTLVFTATAYRKASRPLVLVDLSLGMLRRGAERLGDAPAMLVQADLLDLPFAPNRFSTVACFGCSTSSTTRGRRLPRCIVRSRPVGAYLPRCS
ncbi:MAG: class I SAM-dependent methyltransferase [Actinomycetota bacterium]|nr:class I SAM-dependent methyltransferase [Actinomycetota bacterium]